MKWDTQTGEIAMIDAHTFRNYRPEGVKVLKDGRILLVNQTKAAGGIVDSLVVVDFADGSIREIGPEVMGTVTNVRITLDQNGFAYDGNRFVACSDDSISAFDLDTTWDCRTFPID